MSPADIAEDCTRAVYNPHIDQSLHYTGDLDVYLTAVRLIEANVNFRTTTSHHAGGGRPAPTITLHFSRLWRDSTEQDLGAAGPHL